MSIIQKDTIKVIAETVGIAKTKDDIALALASDVEYRLREIVQEAMKFMRHSRRDVLTTEDVNSALKLHNVERLYGYTFRDPLRFVRAAGHKDLFFIEEKELDFKEILSVPLPKCPRECSFQLHWLAIDGVQPSIPQNPSVIQTSETQNSKRKPTTMEESTGIENRPSNTNQVPVSTPGLTVKPSVKHTLSRELQLYYEKVTQAITNMGTMHQREDGPEAKETTKKLYSAALNSLRGDPGLHQLVPYFTRFVSQEVSKNLFNLDLLYTLLRMVEALLVNLHLRIDPYLHQLMPSIFTCLVGKKLCDDSSADHWSLRDYAARLISLVCNKFGKSYKDLQPRTTKTLVQTFLDPTKPLTSHYGAIVGLSALGPHCVQLLLIPNISAYVKLLDPKLQQNDDLVVKMEATKCYDAVLGIAGNFLKYAAEYYDKLGSMIALGDQNGLEETNNKLQKESSNKQEQKQTEPPKTDLDEMQIETEKDKNENGSATTTTQTSDADKEAKPKKKRKLSQSQAPPPRTPLLQIIAMQELDNINARYQEFYNIFGESLLPFIRHSSFVSGGFPIL